MGAPPASAGAPVSNGPSSSEGTPALPPIHTLRPTLRREWLLLTLSLLVLAAVVLPPLINLGRFQHRVVETMSRSLGRPVSMRSVTLRLLPTPALVLSDVLVNEQPGFGAEPILLAPALTAELRLSSLWRGRFEVSRVDISDASLNLVRTADGRWNIGSVLLQASQVRNAPTSQRRAGPAPRFPYIAITDSRVNVKQGTEKLPYSLLNANLSVWLDQPDVWQLKLDAQPVRTDIALGLSDTGILRMEGRLHRAPATGSAALGHLPLTLHADWANAPLGQATRLALGRDAGWRGDLHATADLSGELDALAVETHVVVANLHREEFAPAEPFEVDATCRTHYQRQAKALRDLVCRWPVDDGQILLRGNAVAGGDTALELTADRLPAGFLLTAAALAHSEPTPTLHLEGAVTGTLTYQASYGRQPVYAGALQSSTIRLTAPGLSDPLTLNQLRLAPAALTPSSTLLLSVAPVDLGGPTPVTPDVQLTAKGVLLHGSGSASIARLLELGRATHLLPRAIARLEPEGSLDFDLTHPFDWQPNVSAEPTAPTPSALEGQPSQAVLGSSVVTRSSKRASVRSAFTRPTQPRVSPAILPDSATPTGTEGWLRLRNVRYAPPFLSGSVSISQAQATFLRNAVTWTIPAATFRHLAAQASVTYPLACSASEPCIPRFHVSFATLDAKDLAHALSGSDPAEEQAKGNTLADLIRIGPAAPGWPMLAGTMHADTLTLGRLMLHQANASLTLQQREAHIEALDAKTLGGSLTGTGAFAVEDRTVHTTLETTLTSANAVVAGALFHENWGPGTITITSELKLSGLSEAELADSAAGSFEAEWSHGALGSAATPLAHFLLWAARGSIADRKLTLSQSTLTGALPASRQVTGTVGFDRTLNLRLGTSSPPAEPETVGGTLSQPR